MKAIKRISTEFCQDEIANGVRYVEARFCPHLMLDETKPEITAKDVLKTVLEAFNEAETNLGLKARVILCCLNGLSQFSQEILELCHEFKNEGVVAIDIAVDEGAIAAQGGSEL